MMLAIGRLDAFATTKTRHLHIKL